MYVTYCYTEVERGLPTKERQEQDLGVLNMGQENIERLKLIHRMSDEEVQIRIKEINT